MHSAEPKPETLAQRLRERQAEIVAAVQVRVLGLYDQLDAADPEYVEGLRSAVEAALDYGIEALERDDERPAPVPAALMDQARLAARRGVSLDQVLRRYFVGYALLIDFVVTESERPSPGGRNSIKRNMRIEAGVFDHLIATVTEIYRAEAEQRAPSSEARRTELVERLLEGEVLDASELRYEFAGYHIAVILWGRAPDSYLQQLARLLDRRLLTVRRDHLTVWAWLGGRRRLSTADLCRAVEREVAQPNGLLLAVGESAPGLLGWRTTHRQAKAALPIAIRRNKRITLYSDVALVASIARDDLLSNSLQEKYLAPLEEERDGGATLRRTLRAYISAGLNTSSTAAVLRVNRHTVMKRLRLIEERVGCPLSQSVTEFDAALRIDEVGKTGIAE